MLAQWQSDTHMLLTQTNSFHSLISIFLSSYNATEQQTKHVNRFLNRDAAFAVATSQSLWTCLPNPHHGKQQQVPPLL